METIKIKSGRVTQLISESSGNPVANQFMIYGEGFSVFQSYQSAIVLWKDGKTYLDYSKWDYSTTTGKYRNQVLGEKKPETERKIKSGKYILANLNPKD